MSSPECRSKSECSEEFCEWESMSSAGVLMSSAGVLDVDAELDILNRKCSEFGSVWKLGFDKWAEFNRVLGAHDLRVIVWPSGRANSCRIDRDPEPNWMPTEAKETPLIHIGSDMLLKLASRLQFHPNLRILNLRGNAQGCVAIHELASSLTLLTALTTLNLSSMPTLLNLLLIIE
jgi:hypothetical protein